MEGLKIGVVAKQSGVNLQTVHYYERRGLVPKPPRSASNYRLYPTDTVRRIRFIKHAQDLGFTLKEIQDLLRLRATTGARCGDVLKRAGAKIQEIDEKIRSLKSMRKALARLTDECRGQIPISDCPILESLQAEE